MRGRIDQRQTAADRTWLLFEDDSIELLPSLNSNSLHPDTLLAAHTHKTVKFAILTRLITTRHCS